MTCHRIDKMAVNFNRFEKSENVKVEFLFVQF